MKVIKDTHLAVSNFTADTLVSMWIDALTRSPLGIDRVADELGFTKRDVHAGRLRFPGMSCPICGATTPTADPARWTVYRTSGTYPRNPSGFRCEMGSHSFGLDVLIERDCPTKPKVKALLEKIGICKPQLIRTYTAEHGDYSETGRDAELVAKEVLPVVHDCSVRIVGIDSPSLDIGRQIAGQCRGDLPWADVAVEPDGSLIDLHWHKGALTELEKNRTANREITARFKNIKRVEEETESFRRQRRVELGLEL